MKKMGLRDLILIVNLCLLGALIFQYFWGAPSPAIMIAALLCFLIANAVFYVLLRRSKKKEAE
jgi:hypothetical protein